MLTQALDFYWNCDGGVSQSAYQIVCLREEEVIWDSGKVSSSSMTHIFSGKAWEASIHCFYSWTCFRYSLETEPESRRWIVWLQGIFSFALFAATTLIKQHYFIDVIGGIAVAELALQITNRTALPHLFGKSMAKITSRLFASSK